MHIQFSQLYSEIEVDYYIPSTILRELREKLNHLDKTIPHYNNLFHTDDYMLLIFISATLLKNTLSLSRPLVSSKNKIVQFFIDIPFIKIDDFITCMEYLLSCTEDGILMIFKKYKLDPTGVSEVIADMKESISINTKFYKEEYDKVINRWRTEEEAY
jgi:hypothetical protein